jgi:hypothetical protein
VLEHRLMHAPAGADAVALWRSLGIADAERIPDLGTAEVIDRKAA